MLTVSSQIAALLASRPKQQFIADLFTFQLRNGETYRYTNAPRPITIAGQTYSAGTKVIRGKIKLSRGLSIDSHQLRINEQSGLILDRIMLGYFNLATYTLARVFAADALSPWLGPVTRFVGQIASVDEIGLSYAKLTAKSMLNLLDNDFPRTLLQKDCPNVLFDSACGLARSNYLVGAITAAGSTTNTVLSNLSGHVNGYFAQGVLSFTSGVMSGLSYMVKSSLGGGAALAPISGIDAQSNWIQPGNVGDLPTGGQTGKTGGFGTYSPSGAGRTYGIFAATPNYDYQGFYFYAGLAIPVSLAIGSGQPLFVFQQTKRIQFPTASDISSSQAIEFEMQLSFGGWTYNMAWQRAPYESGGVWRYFTYLGVNAPSAHWNATAIPYDPAAFPPGSWATVTSKFVVDLIGHTAKHVSLTINGIEHFINITQSAINSQESQYLHAAFQLDCIAATSGQARPPAYNMWVDQWSIQMGNGVGASEVLYPAYPLLVAPAAGDTFSVTPGCDKTLPTCIAKYSYTPANGTAPFFRGTPFIPDPTTVY